MQITWTRENDHGHVEYFNEAARTTRGRRRNGHNAVNGPDRARFRGPGRGKKDYPDGKNPKRSASGGRAD